MKHKLRILGKYAILLVLLIALLLLLILIAAPQIEPSPKGQGIVIGVCGVLIQQGIWYLMVKWTEPDYKLLNL